MHIAKLQKQLEEKENELLIERTTNDNWYKRKDAGSIADYVLDRIKELGGGE